MSKFSEFHSVATQFRILIVGKNSRIVKSMKGYIAACEVISHHDLDLVDIAAYDKIFVFSWSHNSLEENISLLRRLNLKKVVFISTVAVLSCAKRAQWASYPNQKIKCENLVLAEGGQIIRVGIWDVGSLDYLTGFVPVTTIEAMISAMLEAVVIAGSRIIWPITLMPGRLCGLKLYLSNFLNKASLILPGSRFLQIPIALASKFLGFKNYGYTHDCLLFFSQRVLVGFGAVGSAVSQELKLLGLDHAIVASLEKNIFLNDGGFKGLRIGQWREGLSKLWHGVYITKQANNILRKNVPLFVRRPALPKKAIYGSVCQVDFGLPMHSIKISHPIIADVRVFASAIHLAAGVINNVKILQNTYSIDAFFSDHEIGEVGNITTNELVQLKLVTRKCGFVMGRNIQTGCYGDFEYMIDFRPKASNTIKLDAENIYNNRSDQIISKLFKSLSGSLINQAIFNKFGVAFDTGLFSVIIQIEAPNCIKLNKDGKLSRVRLSTDTLEGISQNLSDQFKSFRKSNKLETFDAIHIHGGFKLALFPELTQHLEAKKLFLHGNVFNGGSLGAFHNTVAMINREREIIKNG